MNHFKPYNPSGDGFAAKAWECLRRNPTFIQELEHIEALPETARNAAYQLFAGKSSHPLHTIAIGAAIGEYATYEYDIKTPMITGRDFAWPDVPIEIREDIEHVLMPDDALHLKRPHKLNRWDSHNRSLYDVMELANHYEIIAVPKLILDAEHSQRIAEQVQEFLSNPVGSTKRLRPNGGTLGSPREWDSFLRAEQWKKLGIGRGRACDLIAAERYDGNALGGESVPESKNRADAYLDRNPLAHKRRSLVDADIEHIEASIGNVYPEFRPEYF